MDLPINRIDGHASCQNLYNHKKEMGSEEATKLHNRSLVIFVVEWQGKDKPHWGNEKK